MSGDFAMFETDTDGLSSKDDIEAMLESLRNMPQNEVDEIQGNLWESLSKTEIDWFSSEMIILNGITVLLFFLFGKKLH